MRELQDLRDTRTPEPVAAPPAFAHAPGTLPPAKPYQSPELRREKSRMSNATLAQMAGASGIATGAGLAAAFAPGTENPRTSEEQRRQNMARYTEDRDQRGLLSNANPSMMNANPNGLPEGLVVGKASRPSFEYQAPPPVPTPPIPEHQYLPSNSNYPQYAQEYSNRSLPPQPTAPKASPQLNTLSYAERICRTNVSCDKSNILQLSLPSQHPEMINIKVIHIHPQPIQLCRNHHEQAKVFQENRFLLKLVNHRPKDRLFSQHQAQEV